MIKRGRCIEGVLEEGVRMRTLLVQSFCQRFIYATRLLMATGKAILGQSWCVKGLGW